MYYIIYVLILIMYYNFCELVKNIKKAEKRILVYNMRAIIKTKNERKRNKNETKKK